jgi:hypothetical protein
LPRRLGPGSGNGFEWEIDPQAERVSDQLAAVLTDFQSGQSSLGTACLLAAVAGVLGLAYRVRVDEILALRLLAGPQPQLILAAAIDAVERLAAGSPQAAELIDRGEWQTDQIELQHQRRPVRIVRRERAMLKQQRDNRTRENEQADRRGENQKQDEFDAEGKSGLELGGWRLEVGLLTVYS